MKTRSNFVSNSYQFCAAQEGKYRTLYNDEKCECVLIDGIIEKTGE